MSKKAPADKPGYDLLPAESAGFDSLAELALDMRWSWNHAADEIWRQLDPELWELTHNPWVVLQTVSREKLAARLWPTRLSAGRSTTWCRPGGRRRRRPPGSSRAIRSRP